MPNLDISEDERKRVGDLVCGYIQAGIDTQGRAPEWWGACQRIHNMGVGTDSDFSVTGVDDNGLPQLFVNFSQPRLDALKDQVCAVVVKQEPYVLCETDEQDLGDDKAEFVHRVWKDGGFERAFETACSIATDTDLAFLRMCPLPKGGVEWTAIDPSDVIVYPALGSGFKDAVAIGHKVPKSKRSVIEGRKGKKAERLYYGNESDEIAGAAYDDTQYSGEIEQSGSDPYTAGPEDADRVIDLWDVILRLDVAGQDDQTTYHAVVDFDGRELLSLQRYPHSDPWYFEVRLLGRGTTYYPTRSVGRMLSLPQDAYSKLWSGLYNALQMSIVPPIFGPKLSNDEKYTTYGPGQYIETDGQTQPWAPAVHAQLGPILPAIGLLDTKGDEIAKISRNTVGAAPLDQTATAASITAAGVAVGVEGYIRNGTMDLPAAARLTCEYGAMYYRTWGSRFGLQDPNPAQTTLPMPPEATPQPDPLPSPQNPYDAPPMDGPSLFGGAA